MYIQLSSGARGLIIGLSLHPLPYFVNASRKGSSKPIGKVMINGSAVVKCSLVSKGKCSLVPKGPATAVADIIYCI